MSDINIIQHFEDQIEKSNYYFLNFYKYNQLLKTKNNLESECDIIDIKIKTLQESKNNNKKSKIKRLKSIKSSVKKQLLNIQNNIQTFKSDYKDLIIHIKANQFNNVLKYFNYDYSIDSDNNVLYVLDNNITNLKTNFYLVEYYSNNSQKSDDDDDDIKYNSKLIIRKFSLLIKKITHNSNNDVKFILYVRDSNNTLLSTYDMFHKLKCNFHKNLGNFYKLLLNDKKYLYNVFDDNNI